jgi:hypothetical protein
MRFVLSALVATLVVSPLAAFGATSSSTLKAPVKVVYTSAFTPHARMGSPYTGTLTLTFNPDNIISGQYRGDSIRPDPFNNRITMLSGGVTGKYVHFSSTGFGPPFSFNGQLDAKGKLIGTARIHGRVYDFAARPDKASPVHS